MTALLRRFKRMFKCDSVRITKPLTTMFLIIGNKRSTRKDKRENGSVWVDERGKEKHWTYTTEQVIASGDTEAELIASAKHYKRLTGMTMEQYLKQL